MKIMNKLILNGLNDDKEELQRGDEDEIDQCLDMHLINNKNNNNTVYKSSESFTPNNNNNNKDNSKDNENDSSFSSSLLSSIHKDSLDASTLLPSQNFHLSPSSSLSSSIVNTSNILGDTINSNVTSNNSPPNNTKDSGYDELDKNNLNSKLFIEKSSENKEKYLYPDNLELFKNEINKLNEIIAEKDKQLDIAAQYGISLLQKNEELQLLVDMGSIESTRMKIEQLTNEKYQMKMQQESTNHEYEVIINDLRSDILTLNKTLEEERKVWKVTEKEFAVKVEELMLCNEQLSEQMLNASMTEEEARHQMASLKLRVTESEMEQNGYLETLQKEIIDTRVEMDKMIELKSNECKILSCALDEAQNKINQLEKEKDIEYNKAKHFQEELLKLEDKYVILLSKIESPDQSHFSMSHLCSNEASLFAELDILSDAFDSNSKLYGKAVIGVQLRQEILEVYRQIHRLTLEVKGQGQLWSPEIVDICDLKAGQLLLALSELQELISRRFNLGNLPPLNDEQDRLGAQVGYLKEQMNILKEQLNCNKTTLNSVKEELNNRNNQLERSMKEKENINVLVHDLKRDISELQKRFDKVREQKLIEMGDGKDLNVVLEFQNERDAALAREQDLRSQLFNSKLDLVELDRQLMEAVEHKLQLSNQLEAWQNDMHDLIEDKMAGEMARDKLKGSKKLQQQHPASSSSLSSTLPHASSLLSRPRSFTKKLFPKWS